MKAQSVLYPNTDDLAPDSKINQHKARGNQTGKHKHLEVQGEETAIWGFTLRIMFISAKGL